MKKLLKLALIIILLLGSQLSYDTENPITTIDYSLRSDRVISNFNYIIEKFNYKEE